MMVTVNPENLLNLVPACPEWCAFDRDHDVDELARGERSRIHWSSPGEGSASVLFDDNPENLNQWWIEPPAVQLSGSTARELAEEIRRHVTSLALTAEWLEAIR